MDCGSTLRSLVHPKRSALHATSNSPFFGVRRRSGTRTTVRGPSGGTAEGCALRTPLSERLAFILRSRHSSVFATRVADGWNALSSLKRRHGPALPATGKPDCSRRRSEISRRYRVIDAAALHVQVCLPFQPSTRRRSQRARPRPRVRRRRVCRSPSTRTGGAPDPRTPPGQYRPRRTARTRRAATPHEAGRKRRHPRGPGAAAAKP